MLIGPIIVGTIRPHTATHTETHTETHSAHCNTLRTLQHTLQRIIVENIGPANLSVLKDSSVHGHGEPKKLQSVLCYSVFDAVGVAVGV